MASYLEECHPVVRALPIAIWDRFIEHGSVSYLKAKIGLTADNIIKAIEAYED